MKLIQPVLIFSVVAFPLNCFSQDFAKEQAALKEIVLGWQKKVETRKITADALQELKKSRHWTSKTGDYKTLAQFVRFDPVKGNVILKDSNKRELSVPIAKLSENDRVYLEGLSKKQQELVNDYPSMIAEQANLIRFNLQLGSRFTKILEGLVKSNPISPQGSNTDLPPKRTPVKLKTIDENKLVYRDDKRYEVNSEIPFTGISVKKSLGRKLWEIEIVNGKWHGKVLMWWENGQKKAEYTSKNGKRHGPYREWRENGAKKEESVYRDGFVVSGKKWDILGRETIIK